MSQEISFMLTPIGVIGSTLSDLNEAPKQGFQGSQEAWVTINSDVIKGIKDLQVGDEILVITWLHLADRSILQVHPQDNPKNPLKSVFATRSADRPNPIGLHPVTVLEVSGDKIRVAPIEAIDGTPVVDIKPVI
jgi:tRNA-Thr(GGU) m(6)t(6)A37 methyltransferase TsaA